MCGEFHSLRHACGGAQTSLVDEVGPAPTITCLFLKREDCPYIASRIPWLSFSSSQTLRLSCVHLKFNICKSTATLKPSSLPYNNNTRCLLCGRSILVDVMEVSNSTASTRAMWLTVSGGGVVVDKHGMRRAPFRISCGRFSCFR